MVTKKVLPVRQVREKMSQLLNEAEAGGEPIMITRNGRPAGYLVGYEAFNRLMEQMEERRDGRVIREARPTWHVTQQRRPQTVRVKSRPEERQDDSSPSPYLVFKARLAAKYPDLLAVSPEEAARRLDELAEKVRQELPFDTWQEAQAFMRRESGYDLDR